jgi:deoxyribonuclease-4
MPPDLAVVAGSRPGASGLAGLGRTLDFVETQELSDGAVGFAAGHLLHDVGAQVALDDDAIEATQGLLDREREVEDVHAVAVLFDLLLQGLDLAADDLEAAERLGVGFWCHGLSIGYPPTLCNHLFGRTHCYRGKLCCMRIGAHISSAGGPDKVFARAAAIEAEAIQLFISAPQQWKLPALTDAQVEAFRAGREAANVPIFFHGVYLMNFGSQDETILDRSVASLSSYLKWSADLGVVGTIFHVGSHLGAGFEAVLPQICTRLRSAMDAAPNGARVILENNAGQGNCVGRTFAELGAIFKGLDNDPRLGVCIDSCHAFAMGYDISTREGCEIAMEEFDREIGFDRLLAVHSNDSKMPLGGVRDRHEIVGDGHIGLDGFRALMGHRAFADVPFLLEVPGITGDGPDLENVNRLKTIRAELKQ